mgnify:FL=1
MSKIKELVQEVNPVLSATATALGAYWFLSWFRTLGQQEYAMIVGIAFVVYVLIAKGDMDI